MASLHLRSGGTYHLSFRYQGISFQRSLRTSDRTEAQQRKSGIERTLKLLDEGILSLGPAVTSHEIWRFLQSNGKPGETKRVRKSVTLRFLAEAYLKSFPGDAKEASSLKSESIHLNHLCRILGPATLVEDVGPEQIWHYVECRSEEPGIRGRTVRPVTIRKELQTIQQCWAFGRAGDCVVRIIGHGDAHSVNQSNGSKPMFEPQTLLLDGQIYWLPSACCAGVGMMPRERNQSLNR